MRYFILLLFAVTTGCSQQKADCSKFKTGTFKYINDELSHFTITRNDSVQTEYNSKDDVTIETSIEWTSNCEYILTYESVTNHPFEEKVVGEKIYVTILDTDGNSYECRVFSSSTDSKIKIVKVKD